jgi:hypothetical protein
VPVACFLNISVWYPVAVKMQVVRVRTVVLVWVVGNSLKERTVFIHSPARLSGHKTQKIIQSQSVYWQTPGMEPTTDTLCICVCHILTALRDTSTVETLLLYDWYTDFFFFIYGLFNDFVNSWKRWWWGYLGIMNREVFVRKLAWNNEYCLAICVKGRR